jgi:UDP-GlcNAc:undecaprenyl-phosphate GlcNAc-1-phosphate transferase
VNGPPGAAGATVVAGLAAAGAARAAWAGLRAAAPGGAARWERTNHRSEVVTLLEGPAWALAALAGIAAAPGLPPRVRAGTALAVAGAGVLGAVDDLVGTSGDKGLRGHLGALASGRVTTGAVKVLGIGATGVAAAGLLLPREAASRPAAAALDVVVAGGVVAGAANLLNLLDLRPGRALKATVLAASPVMACGPAAALGGVAVGASAALLPEDLAERAMLGDAGANAAGALLGCAVVAATAGRGRRGAAVRAAILAALAGLTAASEKVSFTRVIEGTPVLRTLDALGRRRAEPLR